MTFKFIVSRPPFAVEFETGSISEGIGVFQSEETEFTKLFGLNFGQDSTALASGTVQGEQTSGGAGEQTDAATTRRTRRTRGGADPANASAPAPIEVPPGAAPPVAPVAPLPAGENANGIPAILDRSNPGALVNQASAAPAAPPAPPAPPVPPAAPAAPPTGVLAGKVAAEIDRRVTGAAEADQPKVAQAMADWLVSCGICVKGATYKEASDVLRLQPDEKLGPIAAQLGVAA